MIKKIPPDSPDYWAGSHLLSPVGGGHFDLALIIRTYSMHVQSHVLLAEQKQKDFLFQLLLSLRRFSSILSSSLHFSSLIEKAHREKLVQDGLQHH